MGMHSEVPSLLGRRLGAVHPPSRGWRRAGYTGPLFVHAPCAPGLSLTGLQNDGFRRTLETGDRSRSTYNPSIPSEMLGWS